MPRSWTLSAILLQRNTQQIVTQPGLRSNSYALEVMAAQAHPELPLEKGKAEIQKHLKEARHWYALKKKWGAAIATMPLPMDSLSTLSYNNANASNSMFSHGTLGYWGSMPICVYVLPPMEDTYYLPNLKALPTNCINKSR